MRKSKTSEIDITLKELKEHLQNSIIELFTNDISEGLPPIVLKVTKEMQGLADCLSGGLIIFKLCSVNPKVEKKTHFVVESEGPCKVLVIDKQFKSIKEYKKQEKT